MASVLLDVDFMIKHTADQGLDLVKSAVEYSPDLLFSLLESGWGKIVREKHPSTSRQFLSHLIESKTPEVAETALKMFFAGAEKETITEKIVQTAASENYSPVLTWLRRNFFGKNNQKENESNVLSALIRQSKQLGADIDLVFTHSINENNVYKSNNHTILSAVVGVNSLSSIRDLAGLQSDMKKALSLVDAGKTFDKATAAVLVRMRQENASMWMDLFLSNNITTASEILSLTSRMKSDPQTNSILSSLSAMEAVNSVLKPQKTVDKIN